MYKYSLQIYIGICIYTMLFCNISGYDSNNGYNNEIKCDKRSGWPPCPGADDSCVCCKALNSAMCLNNGKKTKLKKIPNLPKYVRILRFEGNSLPTLSKPTFHDVQDLNLTYLSLVSNNIRHVTAVAFTDFKYLRTLDISYNKGINVLSVFCAVAKTSIQTLFMNNINFKQIRMDQFHSLVNSSLLHLSLASNNLRILNGSAFSLIPQLTTLNMSKNDIRVLALKELKQLENLDLADNEFLLLDERKFCSVIKRNKSFVPNLKRLNLSNTIITGKTSETFKCLPKVKYLYLDGTRIKILSNNAFTLVESLATLSMKTLQNLQKVEPNVFFGTKIKTLYFTDIDSKINLFKNVRTIFCTCSKLEYLDLSGVFLPKRGDRLKTLLSPLKNLKTLILERVGFTDMPINVFPYFQKLSKLDLSYNKISTWDGSSAFSNMSTITDLYVDNNKISIVTESLFSQELFKSLKFVDFADNPFHCTCDNRWFRDFTRSPNPKPIRFYGINSYRCSYPPALNKTLLKDYNPTEDACKMESFLVTSIIVLSAILVTFLCISGLVYKLRWHIRYQLYVIKGYRRGYKKLTGDTDFIYSGYVVYADEDREWVHNTLLTELERRYGYKLCIRLRDFKVGGITADDMVENFYSSNKIIMVLSNNFARCEWCIFQLALVQNRLIKEGKSMMILIMLEEIKSDYLSNFLHWMITSTSHYAWSEEDIARTIFWDQILTAMRLPNQKQEMEPDTLQQEAGSSFQAFQTPGRNCSSSCVIQ